MLGAATEEGPVCLWSRDSFHELVTEEGITIGPGRGGIGLTLEAQDAVDRCREEARGRLIDPVTPILVLYGLVETFESVRTLIEDAGIDLPEFKRNLERMLDR